MATFDLILRLVAGGGADILTEPSGEDNCLIPPVSWRASGFFFPDFEAGDACVAIIQGDGVPSDDVGNSWTEVASQGDMHCYVCLGPNNFTLGTQYVYFPSAYLGHIYRFNRGNWPGIAAVTHLDPTPIDTAQGTFGFYDIPETAEPNDQQANTDEVTINYDQVGYLYAIGWKNELFPQEIALPGGPYYRNQVQLHYTTGPFATEQSWEVCNPPDAPQKTLPPSWGFSTMTGDVTCENGDISFNCRRAPVVSGPSGATSASTVSIDYLVVAFKIVEAHECGGVSPDPDNAGLSTGPCCRHDFLSKVYVAFPSETLIDILRSPHFFPPVEATTLGPFPDSGYGHGEPDIEIVDEELRMAFTRYLESEDPPITTDVWWSKSGDEGETWSTPEMLFTNAKHPVIATDVVHGGVLYACYKASGTEGVAGTLYGRYQGPGDDNPGTEFQMQSMTGGLGAPLQSADDSFDIKCCPDDPENRWLIVLRSPVTGDILHYSSSDEGETWELKG